MNRGRNEQGQHQRHPSGCHFRYYKLARKGRAKEEKEEGVHVPYYRIHFYCWPITAVFWLKLEVIGPIDSDILVITVGSYHRRFYP